MFIENRNYINLEYSYEYCEQIAKKHYENFPVGSILVPQKLRKYFYSIYAFSRLADDIADEDIIEENQKLSILIQLENSIYHIINSNNINNPILLALKDTINTFEIPIEPLIDLIQAFKKDVQFQPPNTWSDVISYCNQSANPVGELILRLFGEYNKENKILSDRICTGLQLINFWQDLSQDFQIGRCYIPIEILEKYKLKFEDNCLIGEIENVNKLLNEIYDYTKNIFDNGKSITKNIKNSRLKLELAAIIIGGTTIFAKIKKLENKILKIRPKITKFELILKLFKINIL